MVKQGIVSGYRKKPQKRISRQVLADNVGWLPGDGYLGRKCQSTVTKKSIVGRKTGIVNEGFSVNGVAKIWSIFTNTESPRPKTAYREWQGQGSQHQDRRWFKIEDSIVKNRVLKAELSAVTVSQLTHDKAVLRDFLTVSPPCAT